MRSDVRLLSSAVLRTKVDVCALSSAGYSMFLPGGLRRYPFSSIGRCIYYLPPTFTPNSQGLAKPCRNCVITPWFSTFSRTSPLPTFKGGVQASPTPSVFTYQTATSELPIPDEGRIGISAEDFKTPPTEVTSTRKCFKSHNLNNSPLRGISHL